MKRLRLAACILALSAVLGGGALALEGGDSLLSLRYLTDVFLPGAEKQLDQINEQAVQGAFEQVLSTSQEGGSGLQSADFRSRTFSQGDILTLPAGSGLLFYGGTVTLAHNGAVIDVTQGTEVPSGSSLTAGHRYLVGEDTLSAVAVRSGVAYLGVEGGYTFTDAGTQAVPFVDVAEGDWYASAVEYVYSNGLFSGTSADAFSPNLAMNRAMVMTVFYRLAGSPEGELAAARAEFDDVPPESWYAAYVSWGYVQGITAGTGTGRFSPDESVSRQQLLVMLHSFARRYLGLSLTGTVELSAYGDGGQVAAWGQEAMSWAVAKGLISPTADGMLRPNDPASRAEVAAILMKFDSLYG